MLERILVIPIVPISDPAEIINKRYGSPPLQKRTPDIGIDIKIIVPKPIIVLILLIFIAIAKQRTFH